MNPTINCLWGGLVLLACTGCTTLHVKRISAENPSPEGQRYSLPKPFVQVTPQADGSIVADVIFVPDADKTYAIISRSYFATSTLTVALENGLLKKLSWTGDSASVMAEGVKSFASLREKQAAEETKQQTTFESKVAAAKKVWADANLARKLAEKDRSMLTLANSDAAARLKADMAVEQAKIRVEQAEHDLRALLGVTQGSPIPGLDAGAAGQPPLKVEGPVLYAINEDGNGTRLVEQTATVPATPAKPKPLTLSPVGVLGIGPDQSGRVLGSLKASKGVKSIEVVAGQGQQTGPLKRFPSVWANGADISVEFTGFVQDIYSLTLTITTADNKTADVSVMIQVHKP